MNTSTDTRLPMTTSSERPQQNRGPRLAPDATSLRRPERALLSDSDADDEYFQRQADAEALLFLPRIDIR